MRLAYSGLAVGTLADGSRITTRKFAATADWHGQPRDLIVRESEGGPMIGMSLLYGSRVAFEARDDGALLVEPLS